MTPEDERNIEKLSKLKERTPLIIFSKEEISAQRELQKEQEILKEIVVSKFGKITPEEIKSIESMDLCDCRLFIALLTP